MYSTTSNMIIRLYIHYKHQDHIVIMGMGGTSLRTFQLCMVLPRDHLGTYRPDQGILTSSICQKSPKFLTCISTGLNIEGKSTNSTLYGENVY